MSGAALRWLLASGVLLLAPAQATELGRFTFVAPEGVSVLALEHDGARLTARAPGEPSAVWQLGITPAGLRILAMAGESPPCAALAVTVRARDLDADGVLETHRGESLTLYVVATLAGAGTPAVVAAIDVLARSAGVRWLVSRTTLPALERPVGAPAVARIHDAGAGVAREVLLLGSGWPLDASRDPRHAPGQLLVLDADSGRALPLAPPPFPASLPGGVTPVDLDGDELADRVYLADAAARLWRLDLPRPGRPGPAAWRPQLLADFSTALSAGQAFVFAPDVVRLEPSPPRIAQLAITVGSSDRELPSAAAHWLFQLRDPVDDSPVTPLTAYDLPLRGPADDGLADDGSGFRRRLPASLAAPLLTVAGRLLVVTRQAATMACRVSIAREEVFTVTALELATGVAARTPASPVLTVLAPAGAALSATWAEAAGRAQPQLVCRLGDSPLPLCPPVPRLRREWWSRSDAP